MRSTATVITPTHCDKHGSHPAGYLCHLQVPKYIGMSRDTFLKAEHDPDLARILDRRRIHRSLYLYKIENVHRFIEAIGIEDTADTPNKSVSRRIERGNGKSRRDSHVNS